MGRNLAALLAGLVFGLGLTVSQMVNPTKVLAFLDIFGDWDPSLALVMISALAVTAAGYRLVWRQPHPLFADRFQLPGKTGIDARLGAGAVRFGVGWGLVAASFAAPEALGFLLAMAAGMAAFELIDRFTPPRKPA